MARESNIELKVGVLIVVCLVIVVGFFLLLGNVRFGESAYIEVDWPTSSGLREGAPVKIVGMAAGRVESVQYLGGKMDEAVGRRVYVRVKLSIKPELRETLRSDAKFYLTTLGMLGEKYIEIDPGASDKPLPADLIPLGIPPMRIEVMAANLNQALTTATRILADNEEKIGQTLDDISKAAASSRIALDEGKQLVSEVRQTIKNVELKTTSVLGAAEVAIVEFTPGKGETGSHLNTIMARGANMATSLDEAVGDGSEIKGVLRDTRALTAKARIVIDRVGGKAIKVADRVEGLVGTAETTLVEGKSGVLETLANTNELLAVIKQVTSNLRDGKGTVGAMLNDRELFDDARELMKNLKRHPWKFLWKE